MNLFRSISRRTVLKTGLIAATSTVSPVMAAKPDESYIAHPITRGIKPFYVTLDDQFDVQIKEPSRTTVLFKCIAVHDKRVSVNGWCLEQGKGKVVGLLPGHHQFIYRMPQYQEIFWRAAHWAMNREIPPYPNASTDTKGFV